MNGITDVVVRQLDKKRWALVQPISVDIIPSVLRVDVPKGFVTDFASVPRIFWWLFPRTGLHSRAAIVHDYMYAMQWPKDISDSCFLIVMQRDNVNVFARYLMHKAVKKFGNPSNSVLEIVEDK